MVLLQGGSFSCGYLLVFLGSLLFDQFDFDWLPRLIRVVPQRTVETVEGEEAFTGYGRDPVLLRNIFWLFRREIDVHRTVGVGRWVLLAADAR